MAISRIELTKKWWTTNRPKEVKGADLERALAAVEQAKDDSLADALAAVPNAIIKATRELDKKIHKDLLKALDALAGMAEAQQKKAETELKASAQAKAKAEDNKTGDEDQD